MPVRDTNPVKLILTHDNADFDAVASLLAAHKLDTAAAAVLPRRLNRNVEHFLNLYAPMLPFVHPDELKRGGNVSQVTVVDSQSFTTPRGMRPATPVHFIDHHPLSRELTSEQSYTGELVGATTTLLIEQMISQRISIKPIEATLFMLGIYEDTGSLLYGTTTARDIQAAAWLFERGADLDIVREFLQHPLTAQQRGLYERLLEAAETHHISGHVIVTACTITPEPVDEIATLAHKIRDLYDPSAVFVVVQLNDDTQLVARGTSDAIDVSRIAVHFGGGGHGRAAAALIRGRSADSVRQEILDLLPDIVTASINVETLMSVGVQTIDARTRVEAASARMQRTGHEGFPVLKDGQLAGLLTRRAVDRAMNHGMHRQPVERIMDAGQVFVRPQDSIDVLQQRMMRSGWGQIPVLDDSGALLGIVTRTDLIKQWGQPADTGRRSTIVARMQRALTPGLWTLIDAISREAQAQQVGLYLVGGFVRDLLLDIPNVDIDLVVEGDAIALVYALQTAYGGDVRSHAQFGTGKWLLDNDVAETLGVDPVAAEWPPSIDLVTARTEFYEEPTALPTVERGSIKLDLLRRDFTINTLAIRLSPGPLGELLDFYGGEQDLHDGIIRVLHSLSFVDDPTRILRAVRLEQRLDFTIEPRTEELIHNALGLLDRVSGDRVRHELALILAEVAPLRALTRLERLRVLHTIHPSLRIDEWVRCAFYALRYAREHPPWPELASFDHWMLTTFSLLTSRLSGPELDSLGRRLQFSRANLNHLHNARTAIAMLGPLSAKQPASHIVNLLEPLDQVGWLAAWAAAPTAIARENIVRYAREWRLVKPTINGRDLQAITGLRPGPVYGELLWRLRQAWLDGEILSAEDERALLLRLVETIATEAETSPAE